jgi:hypothetical protein
LLQYIKTCDARLLHTVTGIFDGCLFEGFYEFTDLHSCYINIISILKNKKRPVHLN